MTESIQATSIYRFDFLRSTAILRFPTSQRPRTSHLYLLLLPNSHLLPHFPSPTSRLTSHLPPTSHLWVAAGGGGSGAGRGMWYVGNTMSHGNWQVRSDRCDRRPESMPVFAVGSLGLFWLEASRVRLLRAQREKKNMWPSGQSNQKSALQVTKAYAALFQHYLAVATARLPPLQELVKQKA